MTSINANQSKPSDYQALIYASQGDIEKLKTLPPLVWGKLAIASQNPEKKFTPLHYAIGNAKWPMVAFLINANCNPHLQATNGKSAIHLLSNDPASLQKLLTALVEQAFAKDLESLLKLITDSNLLTQRRMVLEDKELCAKIGSAFPKQEALLILTALMVGSYEWKGIDNDFSHHVTGGTPFTHESSINCSQLLQCASLLGGMSIEDLDKYLMKGHKTFTEEEEKQHERYLAGLPMDKEGLKAKKAVEKAYAINMGLPATNRVLWNPRKKPSDPIRVFYVEIEGSIIHYGLLFSGKGKPMLIHIYGENLLSKHVVCEEVEPYLTGMKKCGAKIYLSMLPWIE